MISRLQAQRNGQKAQSEPLRIFDFGGAAGIDFANLIAANRDISNIS
jgi:hypothetical protein